MKITLQTRRKFLRTSALGAAATWTLPVFLEKTFFTLNAMAADAMTQAMTGKDNTVLVVLQLAGGNDGLNTVVPFADDTYHRARPQLALAADKILKLDSYAGLNGKLAGLKSLYEEGEVAVDADGKPLSEEEVFYRQLIGGAEENAPAEGNSIAALPGKTQTSTSTEDFLRRTALDAQISSEKISAIARKYRANVPYPQTQL